MGLEGHSGCGDECGGGGHLGDRGVGGDGGECADRGMDGHEGYGDGLSMGSAGYEDKNVEHKGHPGCLGVRGGAGHLSGTRSSTPSRRSSTRGGGWGTSSSQNLSNAAFILGANQEKDHHLQRIGAQEQTILVEKAILGQWDGNRCKKGAYFVTDQCERAANTSGSQSGEGES